MTIPTLETERLILRAIDPERDLDAWAAAMADEETVRYIGGKTMNRAESWRNMAMGMGHWDIRGYGFFSVEEKATGRWVGRGGPWFPEGWPEPEIGWLLMDGYERRGYATEGAIEENNKDKDPQGQRARKQKGHGSERRRLSSCSHQAT